MVRFLSSGNELIFKFRAHRVVNKWVTTLVIFIVSRTYVQPSMEGHDSRATRGYSHLAAIAATTSMHNQVQLSGANKVIDPLLLDMRDKLRTEAGREIYSKRQQSVEPVFGIIKDAMGFRQFLHRGLSKVQNEWKLVCFAYNCKRLFNMKMELASGCTLSMGLTDC